MNDQAMKDLPMNMQGFISNIDLKNVMFNFNGVYKSEVLFDDQSIGIYEISVYGMKNNGNS